MSGGWRLEGYDTFAGETYPLDAVHASREEALAAGQRRLDQLDREQPGAGGQCWGGIQDRVYVIGPDGRRERVLGPAWLVDLDGTTALMDGRGPYDWHRVGEDRPNVPAIALVRGLLATGHRVIYVTGRMEQCRAATRAWLARHVQRPQVLLMRRDGDTRPDEVIKREIYDQQIKGAYVITGVLDDRDKVVRMWREDLGLFVAQVAPGLF